VEQQLILDRYRPLEELGEGAFGVVVLAWDTRMQRRVAIKRLPLPLDARGRPHRPPGLAEARTAAMLNHPNIVTVFDFDADSDEAFIVMEYVDGASLAEILDDVDGPLDLDEAAALIGSVCSALEFAHDNGVLHLDIKPENVLVTRDGRVKVADFGVAELSSLSGHGAAYGGTPGYMPPEQLAGAPVTNRTDEWALGALAFEVLTGDNPFDDDAIAESAVRLESFEPPLPSSYAARLPSAIDDVLLAALDPRPMERYPSVGRFAEALLPHLGDPDEGRTCLAELVEPYAEETGDDGEIEGIGLWDRLQGRLGSLLMRAVAGVEAGWLAWIGLMPFTLDTPALAGAIALTALAALLAPGLGIGIGVGCFVAGLAATGAWLIAAVVLVVGGAWWWFVARHSPGAATLPLAAPVLAMARVGLMQPLLAGFALSPVRAALTALIGGSLTMFASAASAQPAPYLAVWPAYALDVWNTGMAAENVRALLSSPAALMALLGWPAAAVFMSVMSARATRVSAALGAVGGASVLGVAYALADQIERAQGVQGTYVGPLLATSLGLSLILVLLVSLLGAPVRGEEEDPYALSTTDPEEL
jgi:predicted Ser/Thr protein kinase